jgi:hypothetical protein
VTDAIEFASNRLGYGAMRLTGAGMWGEFPDREAGIALLRRVVEAGTTFIDTADAYGPHTNEILIHDALHPYPADLVIATKGGFIRGGPDYADFGAVGNREYLRQCAFLSARRLGVDQIDLYYLHSPNATDVPFEDQVATLASTSAVHVGGHHRANQMADQDRRATPTSAWRSCECVTAGFRNRLPKAQSGWRSVPRSRKRFHRRRGCARRPLVRDGALCRPTSAGGSTARRGWARVHPSAGQHMNGRWSRYGHGR